MIKGLLALTVVAALIVPEAALAQGGFFTPPDELQKACTERFTTLREDAEGKARMIRAASERHAPPKETCEIISDYSVAEVRMMKYLEANAPCAESRNR